MKVEKFDTDTRGEMVSIAFGYMEHWLNLEGAISLASQIVGTTIKDASDIPTDGHTVLVKLWVKRYKNDSDDIEYIQAWRTGYYLNRWWDARTGEGINPVAWCEIVMPPI